MRYEMDGCDEHRYIYYVIREVVAFAHINVQIMHKIGYIKIILIFRLAASSEYTQILRFNKMHFDKVVCV